MKKTIIFTQFIQNSLRLLQKRLNVTWFAGLVKPLWPKTTDFTGSGTHQAPEELYHGVLVGPTTRGRLLGRSGQMTPERALGGSPCKHRHRKLPFSDSTHKTNHSVKCSQAENVEVFLTAKWLLEIFSYDFCADKMGKIGLKHLYAIDDKRHKIMSDSPNVWRTQNEEENSYGIISSSLLLTLLLFFLFPPKNWPIWSIRPGVFFFLPRPKPPCPEVLAVAIVTCFCSALLFCVCPDQQCRRPAPPLPLGALLSDVQRWGAVLQAVISCALRSSQKRSGPWFWLGSRHSSELQRLCQSLPPPHRPAIVPPSNRWSTRVIWVWTYSIVAYTPSWCEDGVCSALQSSNLLILLSRFLNIAEDVSQQKQEKLEEGYHHKVTQTTMFVLIHWRPTAAQQSSIVSETPFTFRIWMPADRRLFVSDPVRTMSGWMKDLAPSDQRSSEDYQFCVLENHIGGEAAIKDFPIKPEPDLWVQEIISATSEVFFMITLSSFLVKATVFFHK